MTPSELKFQHETHHPGSVYFSRQSMKFFGDTMSNYGVRSSGDCWELWRKRPVKCKLQNSGFFRKSDFSIDRGVK